MQKNIKGLWTGLILQVLYMGLGLIFLTVLLSTLGYDNDRNVDIGITVAQFLLGGFILYIIHCRIREVKEERKHPEERITIYTS